MNCPYCKEKKPLICTDELKIDINRFWIQLVASRPNRPEWAFNFGSTPINYCPMCGTQLRKGIISPIQDEHAKFMEGLFKLRERGLL